MSNSPCTIIDFRGFVARLITLALMPVGAKRTLREAFAGPFGLRSSAGAVGLNISSMLLAPLFFVGVVASTTATVAAVDAVFCGPATANGAADAAACKCPMAALAPIVDAPAAACALCTGAAVVTAAAVPRPLRLPPAGCGAAAAGGLDMIAAGCRLSLDAAAGRAADSSRWV